MAHEFGYRKSIRDFEREEAERERLEEEARMAPIREMEKTLASTAGKLAQIERERVLTGKDESVYVDPSVQNARMSWDAAKQFNAKQYRLFLSHSADFHPSEANVSALSEYFKRNGLNVINAPTLQAAVERMSALGLLEEKPVETEPTPRPESLQAEPEPQGPILHEGLDLHSGLTRQYTEFEVERMSANQYKRIFRVRKVEELHG